MSGSAEWPTNALNLETLEAFIKVRRKSLVFPDWLERQYEIDTGKRRAERFASNILPMATIYNLLLIGDYLLARDRFVLDVGLHALIVTPYMALIHAVLISHPRRWIREVAATSLPLAIILQVFFIAFSSADPLIGHYLYLILPPLLNACIIQRLFFPYAVSISMISALLQGVTVGLAEPVVWAVGLMSSITILAIGYTLLIANYLLEKDMRRFYLLGLRDRLKLAQADLESRRDALTGLANRHVLHRRIAELWGSQDSRHFPIAVLLLDIDHFKSFNDRYGHPAGDVCLRRVSACMSAELRDADDLAVRYGGEEFLLLLPLTQGSDAERVAERIRSSIEALAIPNEAAGPPARITVSLGLIIASDPAISAEELIAAADAALYDAKRRGRNRICVGTPPATRAAGSTNTRVSAHGA